MALKYILTFKTVAEAMEFIANSGNNKVREHSYEIKTELLNNDIANFDGTVYIVDPNGLLD